ncbi:MAG: NAD(P)-dependent oxidoreductase [Anaerolineae bacterium]
MSVWHSVPVLVTGATGFLGGTLARRLIADGAKVTVLARNAQKAVPLAALGATMVHGDLTNPVVVRDAVKGAQVVFHVAALLGGPYPEQRVVNVDGTRLLLEASLEAGVARFVHVSSIAVYGNVLPATVTEDVPLAPGASPYGLTKSEGDSLVREWSAEHGLAAAVVRPGMIYGSGSNMWTANAFRLARLRPTPFLGDGGMRAPLVYVDDLVDLLLLAGEHPAAVGEAFNGVMGPNPTFREYLGAYSALAGHGDWLSVPPLVGRVAAGLVMLASPRDSTLRDLPDMIEQVIAPSEFSADKARRLLGWQAKVTPAEGARRSAPWLRELGLLR